MCEEWGDMLNEMKSNVVKMLKESQAKKRVMIEGYFLNTRAGIHSGRWVQMLSEEKFEALEEKWHKQQIVEMKAILGRLILLREECEMCLEGLGETVCSGRSSECLPSLLPA